MERLPAGLATGFMILCIIVLAAALPVSADTRILDPGTPFEITKHADSMAYINYNWTVTPANASIHFVMLDPDGTVEVDTTASSYSNFRLSLESGDYKFRWTNNETIAVVLNYNVTSQSTGIDDAEHIFDTVFLGLLVGAVVVVIIIVLVIVVVMRGGRKVPPPVVGHPSEHAPPGETPSPFVPGMCPRCGSPFDSQHTFCPKCGHRVR